MDVRGVDEDERSSHDDRASNTKGKTETSIVVVRDRRAVRGKNRKDVGESEER